MTPLKSKLIALYADMSEMTLKKCQRCRVPYSCCHKDYCEFTLEYAVKEWGIVLTPTSNDLLPLMGDHGCIAPPHLRPLCTAHTCELSSRGYHSDSKFDEKYEKIREEINSLEYQRMTQ